MNVVLNDIQHCCINYVREAHYLKGQCHEIFWHFFIS